MRHFFTIATLGLFFLLSALIAQIGEGRPAQISNDAAIASATGR